MRPDDTVYLRHILDAIHPIEGYVEGFDQDHFAQDRLRQDGVIRQLQIIGEATQRLSPATRTQNPHVPWPVIAGMRDRLIREYFGVDVETVWTTVVESLPPLKATIQVILASLKS